MKFKLCVALMLLTFCTVFAQKEKVKGNKIVMTEQKLIESFNAIEVYDNFQVTIVEDTDNMIKIEADSNVQEFIEYEIVDNVLKISSSKDLRRTKALNITIMYSSELTDLKFYNEAQVRSNGPIVTSDLTIETYDDAEVFLSIESGKLKGVANGKSILELHSGVREAFYQVNENANLKGIITSDTLTVDLYQKGEAKLEGEAKSLLIRADSETNYYGENLNSTTTKVVTEGKSECYVVSTGNITIEAIDESEIYLLGEPKIELNVFLNEASLYKKNLDYSPSRFKIN